MLRLIQFRPRLRPIATAAVLLAGAFPVAALAEEEQLVRADELKARVATLTNGIGFSVIRSGANHMVMTAVRAVPGQPELHENMADLFVAIEGRAEVRVGGKLVDGRGTGRGEWAGGRIEGGKVHGLAAGDILWIPAGAPHQVTPAGGAPFRYLVIKVAKDGAPPPAPAPDAPSR